MVVEYTTGGSFADARRVTGPAALAEWDFVSRVTLTDLPSGQRVQYRVQFVDLGDLKTASVPVLGTFRTPESGERATRDLVLAWSADTCGQGWGIDLARGGLSLYEQMRRVEPDVFIHCGDLVYADNPLLPEVPLADGTLWRNLVTPEKAKVAETLDEFRGQYRYNLLDEHLRRFNAEVPVVATWDDHEVLNNFHEGRSLEDDPRYTEKRMGVLVARARRAFLDYQPMRLDPVDPERVHRARGLGPLADVVMWDMRSSRGRNSANRQRDAGPDTALLGPGQLAWVKAQLRASRATWKVVVTGMPLGLVVTDFPRSDVYEGVANGDPGSPLGRELEIADLLSYIRRERIRNVVFLTGDVHYATALQYHPSRAGFTEFTPFWEFVAGPIHAGTFGPNPLDATFGPEARFVGIPTGMAPNRPPSDGFQFFGTFRVSARSGVATVALHDLSGEVVYRVELPPD
jgi:alkaline phosphatase D